MSHNVEVTMLADQYIHIQGEEVNIHDLELIEVNGYGFIIGCVTNPQKTSAAESTVANWREIARALAEALRETDKRLDAAWNARNLAFAQLVQETRSALAAYDAAAKQEAD